MNNLKLIDHRQVLNRSLKIFGTIDNPLFLAKDVAEWIEHSQVSKMMLIVGEEEKVRKIVPTLGGNQEMWFLTEEGLYEVLMQSRKSIAKEFKKEVKKILKDIRKYGMYSRDELLDNPDFLIEVANQLKMERKEKKLLETKIEKDKPKVIFAEAVAVSKSSVLVGELAKILNQNGIDIGQNRFFDWLRRNGYLISRKGTDYNMPTQRSMDLGLFEIKETAITHIDGHTSISRTPKVTGKGQVYFINKFENFKLISFNDENIKVNYKL